jgi:hypothetical protein
MLRQKTHNFKEKTNIAKLHYNKRRNHGVTETVIYVVNLPSNIWKLIQLKVNEHGNFFINYAVKLRNLKKIAKKFS